MSTCSSPPGRWWWTPSLTRALILVEAYEEKLFLAARNIPYVEVMPVASLDPLSLIKHDKVIATVGALKLLEKRLGGPNE